MIILYLIIIYFLFKPTIESLTSKDYVYLLGDSIYKNNNYVLKKFSVEELLKQKHNNSLVYAEDNATINNLSEQFERIPKKAKNNKNNYIYISCGGNDILNNYNFQNLQDYTIANEIFNNYKKIILNIKKNINCKLVITNIYYPTSKQYSVYHPIIKHWNKKLKRFCKKENIMLFEIDKLFINKSFFVDHIEPSKLGSKTIINYIIDN
jgi:lysophospholipase L1-like esterase